MPKLETVTEKPAAPAAPVKVVPMATTVTPTGAAHWRAGMFFDARNVFAPGALDPEQIAAIKADKGLLVAEVPLAELPPETVVIGLTEPVNGLVPGKAKKPAQKAVPVAVKRVSGGYRPSN